MGGIVPSIYTEGDHTPSSSLGFQSAPGDRARSWDEQRQLQKQADDLLAQARQDSDDYNRRKASECSWDNPGQCLDEGIGIVLLGGLMTVYVLKNL